MTLLPGRISWLVGCVRIMGGCDGVMTSNGALEPLMPNGWNGRLYSARKVMSGLGLGILTLMKPDQTPFVNAPEVVGAMGMYNCEGTYKLAMSEKFVTN